MIELAIILFLLVLNGVFAMAEIALVSSKRARLQQRADEGSIGARKALELGENPERFLSTVQIGITLVGVLAGAFGGASLSGYLVPIFQRINWLESQAEELAFTAVVAGITYLSLIIGELVPKNLALRHSEAIASTMAAPMQWLARMAYPLVWVLEASTRLVLKAFGKAEAAKGPTREEVMVLVREGIVTGVLHREEIKMMDGVFDLRDVRAEEIMRPKPRVIFLQMADTTETVSPQIIATRQSVFPVYDKSRDDVVGLVGVRDLYAAAATSKEPVPLKDLMKEPVFVPDNQPALTLLETLRRAPHLAALVTDEFGILRGMVTLQDLVEEVVGELPEGPEPGSTAVAQLRAMGPDGWLVDGMMEIDPVCEQVPGLLKVVEAEKDSFQTLAGFIVNHLKRLPMEAETFEIGGFSFEVVDMDRQRIDKVLIKALPQQGQEGTETTKV